MFCVKTSVAECVLKILNIKKKKKKKKKTLATIWTSKSKEIWMGPLGQDH